MPVQLQGRLQVADVDAGQDEFRQILLAELAAALLLALALCQIGGEVVSEGGVVRAEPLKHGAGNELAEAVFEGAETVATVAIELGAHVEQVPFTIIPE
ncbi:hypothetical protein D3C85_1559940 [compost metagenome]